MADPSEPPENTQGTPPVDPAERHAARLRVALEAGHAHPHEIGSMPASARRQARQDWAASGAMAMTGPAEGAPRFATGAIASAAIGAGQVLTDLAPVLARPRDAWARLLSERACFFGRQRAGRIAGGGAARLIETADGWCVVHLPRPEDWRSVPAWLEVEPNAEKGESPANWNRIGRHLRTRSLAPLVERAHLLGLAVAPAPRPDRATSIDGPPLVRWHFESRSAPPEPHRPFRVLDLSTLWAGPLATSLLAEAGASVLKVESPARPDGARTGPTDFFDLLNAGKRGVALDLRRPTDHAHFSKLLEQADAVVESARPRGLEQLGIDARRWVEERPGRLWLSITGYGRDAPGIAFGDDATVAAGLAWSHGATHAAPCFCGDALADPLTGLHGAALLLAARRQGRGGLVDLALRDVVAHAAQLPLVPDEARVVPNESGAWTVEDAGEHYAVAPPEARTPRGQAPALVASTGHTLPEWPAPC